MAVTRLCWCLLLLLVVMLLTDAAYGAPQSFTNGRLAPRNRGGQGGRRPRPAVEPQQEELVPFAADPQEQQQDQHQQQQQQQQRQQQQQQQQQEQMKQQTIQEQIQSNNQQLQQQGKEVPEVQEFPEVQLVPEVQEVQVVQEVQEVQEVPVVLEETENKKTHEELLAEELQRRTDELQSRAEELKRRVAEQVKRDEELQRRADEQARRDAFEQKNSAVAVDAVNQDGSPLPKTHAQLLAEELQRREEDLKNRAEEQIRRDEELVKRAEEEARRVAELERRAEIAALNEAALNTDAIVEQMVIDEINRRKAEELLVNPETVNLDTESQSNAKDVISTHDSILEVVERRPMRKGGRGGSHFRSHVSEFNDETLPEDARNKRHNHKHTDQAHNVEKQVAQFTEETQTFVEPQIHKQNEPEPKPKSELKTDTNTKIQNAQATEEILLRQQENEQTHNANLGKKDEIEIKQLELGIAHENAGQDQHAREAFEHDQVNREKEEVIRKQEEERQAQEAEIRRLEEIRIQQEMGFSELKTDTKSDTNAKIQNAQATEEILLRQQENEQTHNANLDKKDEIEIKQLDLGIAHENAGQDQHAREAFEHDQVNREREEMIRRQEEERQGHEAEIRRLEEIRIEQEMERAQREQQDIIAHENNRRSMDINAQQSSQVTDWQHNNPASKLSPYTVASVIIYALITIAL